MEKAANVISNEMVKYVPSDRHKSRVHIKKVEFTEFSLNLKKIRIIVKLQAN
jgi:hypothetical protein